jgi:pyrroloquinoline quinone (PQQ) biosynthesis protein C
MPALECAQLVEPFDHLSRDFPLSAGLSALYFYESQVAEIATAKIDGLQRLWISGRCER